MSFFENTRKPEGLGGKIMVSMMNVGHKAMADWNRLGFPGWTFRRTARAGLL